MRDDPAGEYCRREVEHLTIRKVMMNLGSANSNPYTGVVTMLAMSSPQNSPTRYNATGGVFSAMVQDDTSYLISLNLFDSSGIPHPSNDISMVEYVPSGNSDFLMKPDEIYKHMDGLDPSLANVFSDSLMS